MAEDLNSVVSNIRALIVSSKFPVALRTLTGDYETMIGNPIPYRAFKFHTLESFLQSLPSLKVTGSGRDVVVEAVKDEASSHISNMISKQKTTKKPPPHVRRGGYSQRGSYGRSSYVPKLPAPSRQTAYSSISHHSSYSKKEYSDNRDNVDHRPTDHYQQPRLMVVASDDRRQVSLEGPYSAPKHSQSSQKEAKSSYVLPPRFQKNRQTSVADNSTDYLASMSDITKDVEETLFLDKPTQPDPRLRAVDTNIISALTPSQLVAVGRAKQEVAQSQLDGFYLEGAAKNSNQVQEPPMPQHKPVPMVMVPKPDDTVIQNNVNLLLDYAIAKTWSVPEYSVMHRKPKDGSQALYGATVKLNINGQTKKFLGFPDEDQSAGVAKGYAAKRALEELFEEEKVKLEKPIISSDRNTTNDRISKMVAGHSSGMFASNVESQYAEKYKEQLPTDWLQTLSYCPTLSVETTLNNSIIIPKVLTSPSLDLDLSEPLRTSGPPVLIPPEGNIWDVYVTSATSTCQVWVRLIGENYSEKYEELLTNMEQLYKRNSSQMLALTIEENQYYALVSNDSWHRVFVTAVSDDTKFVNAFLIDHGDNDMFSVTNLYRLHSEFCALPKQAVLCCLEGLESFSDDPSCNQIISSCDHLIGNSLVAEVNSRDESTGVTKVTLFDTSGTDDINVNEKILDSILSEYKSSVPTLPEGGLLSTVDICHISKRGEVYIQIKNDKFRQLEELIESLSPDDIIKHKLTSFRQVKLNKIYLAKFSEDENWYRAVITSTPSVQHNKIAILFVDYGNSETVSINDITDVENLPPIISNLPPQALKVALHNVPLETLSLSKIEKLRTLLLGEDKVIYIKLVNNQQDVPSVEIHSKDKFGTGPIIAVNLTLAMEDMAMDRPDHITNYQANTNVISCTSLKKPTLDDESFYEVQIVLSAHPGNFFFQMKKYHKELEGLMHQLHEFYHRMALPELKDNEIVKGGLYAGFSTEHEEWFRVLLTQSNINSNAIVKLIDYGDIEILPVSNLRKLASEFCKNPFMAIKGKLAGIKPIHTDWCTEDSLRFQELVFEKPLACVVVKVDDKPENPTEMVVSIELINTLSEKDENIADILCEEHRAVRIEIT